MPYVRTYKRSAGFAGYVAAVRGFGQTATAITGSSSATQNVKLLAFGAAVLTGLIVLPGWSKLLVPAGLVGAMVLGNVKECTQNAGFASELKNCPAGVADKSCIGPIDPNAKPALSCLLNPFPGGL